MNNSYYDSSAVDNYINELSKREAIKTTAMSGAIFRQNAPLQALKFIGIGLMTLLIGYGIKHAMSFERTNISQTIHENASGERYEESSSFAESDEVIDIEALMNNSSVSEDLSQISDTMNSISTSDETQTIRDYYIFDTIEADLGLIDEIVVGRSFETPDSGPNYTYCYINIPDTNNISKRFDLIEINEEFGRSKTELNEDLASSLGVELNHLRIAQEKCAI